MTRLLGLALVLLGAARCAAAQVPPDSLATPLASWTEALAAGPADETAPAEAPALSYRLEWSGAAQPSDPRLLAWDPPSVPAFATTRFDAPQSDAERFEASLADSTVSPLDTLQMSRWERVLWGRRGLTRRLGLFPTHPDEPTDDLRQIAHVRRRMLGLHQTLGLVTVASMAATVVGGQIAVSGGGSGFHKATLPFTIGLYSTTAALALLSPPKLVSFEGHRIDSITIHRWLAVGHVAGMILTPLLAPSSVDDARIHQISGYATFATFSAAMLVVTLLNR